MADPETLETSTSAAATQQEPAAPAADATTTQQPTIEQEITSLQDEVNEIKQSAPAITGPVDALAERVKRLEDLLENHGIR